MHLHVFFEPLDLLLSELEMLPRHYEKHIKSL